MIFLGMTPEQKTEQIKKFCAGKDIKKIIVCSPSKFDFVIDASSPVQFVDWPEIIMYRTFYPLLQEIDSRTLVVVNECLRTQDRYDLTYNCIRHYLNQAGHILVFQWLPLIDEMQDFMALFDFATSSRWKRERFDVDLLENVAVNAIDRTPRFDFRWAPVDPRAQYTYTVEREKMFANIGPKDPHTIPRNLYLIGGKSKLALVPQDGWSVGRNNRLKISSMATFKEVGYQNAPYTVFEFPHNFIDFVDFAALSGQTEFCVLGADLKIDRWYASRYQQWTERIADGIANLRSWAKRV